MKKRSFLAPLAVSIAALLGGIPAGHAAVDATTKIESPTKPAKVAGDFVLKRSGDFRLAQYGHDSHMSHDSHESHSSHVSGY